MQLQVDRTPMTRGVTHLMYVGDDQAVEQACNPCNAPKVVVALGAAALLYAIFGKTKHREVLGAAGVVLISMGTSPV